MGVVHRDIKPANVLIDDQGRPRLIDFGLAHRSDFASDLTRDGAIVGTPAYMSPEQAMGHVRRVDERSDVYSLGVIFYELLHGRRPDESGVSSDSQRGGARAAPAVPAALLGICAKAMSANPAARHASARALADDLDRWIQAQRRPGSRLDPRFASVLLGVAAVVLILFGIGIHSLWPFPIYRRGAFERTRERGASKDGTALADSLKIDGARTDDVRLIGNWESRKYHLETCYYAKEMDPKHRLVLESHEQAKSQNYSPCRACLATRPKTARPPSAAQTKTRS
jgi:serine/threonine protein kinase